ncbi:MAG: hypothetical protein ACOCP4_03865 [Candidatus Woesearchaeota archaeon]|uniref:Uncharacterized protein n=1 Tax=Arfiviricetes sp. TaxID=2832556 RepID=A0AB39A3B1_9VIRU
MLDLKITKLQTGTSKKGKTYYLAFVGPNKDITIMTQFITPGQFERIKSLDDKIEVINK